MTAVHVDSPTERPDLLGGIATSKSGLGTPDFFYFAGAADTPSWLKTRPQSANRPDVSHPPSTTTNSAATRLAAQAGDDPLKIAKDSESPANQLVPGENDEITRSRALSDPPIRQTPSWLANNPAAKHLDSEPNPFERSFSGNTPYEMVQMHRRARSISPKSSHGAGVPGSFQQHQLGSKGANVSRLPPFGTMSTPSNDFDQFEWNFGGQDSLRSGPLSPSMLNGPSYGNSNTSAFDPSSIRTGLTPANGINNYAPHSPATQALFAMMTNSTPGLPGVTKMDERIADNIEMINQSYEGGRHQASHPGTYHSASDGSRGSSSSSNKNTNKSITSQSPPRSQHLPHLQPSFAHAQAIPKPLPPHNPYSHNSQPHTTSFIGNKSNGFINLDSQLLQQNAPRPLPAQAISTATTAGTGNANPLYLLSQAHAHINSDGTPITHNPAANPFNAVQNQGPPPLDIGLGVSADDAVLAAAAGLSGLATPRPNNVAGPVPAGHHNIAPTTLNVATSANLALPGLAGQDSAIVNTSGKRTRGRSQQNVSTAVGQTVRTATPPAATTSGQKRKASATKKNQSENKKPKRATRRAAAAIQPIVDEDTPPEDEELDDSKQYGFVDDGRQESALAMEEDTYSNAGSSQRRSESAKVKLEYNEDEDDDGDDGDGTGQKLSTSKQIKAGRGPKQQFETEEEKRKNFLERNRQAALKCRQRKKQWLNELQHKVEILTQENETLQQTAVQIREEAAQLRAILLGHKDCQMSVGLPGMHAGQSVTIGQMLGGPANLYPPQQQPHMRHLQ